LDDGKKYGKMGERPKHAMEIDSKSEGSNHFLSPPQIFCWMFSVKKAISSEHQEHRLTHIETISINMVGLPDFTMKHHTTLPYLVPLQHLQLASISP
jgi:hypothetical protein